jgi:hypothetical protein
MSNMSYCRFQNTLSDLRDCADALEDEDPISEDEAKAALSLVKECIAIIEQLGGAIDDSEAPMNELRYRIGSRGVK